MKIKSLIISLLPLFFISCSFSTNKKSTDQSFDYRILEEVVATEQIHQQNIILNGVITVNEDQLYLYRAPEDGIIESILFSIGDEIKQGDPLLTFKSPHYNELQKELKERQQQIVIKQRNLKSAESLYQDQLLSEKDFLIIQSELTLAKQKLTQVENTLAIYGKPLTDNLFLIEAKQRGSVIHKNITPYLSVSKDDHLLSIANLSTLWVEAQIHPNQIPTIQQDDEVVISSSVYPTKHFKGKIIRLFPTLDPHNKTLKALITVNNKDLELKPAMPVEVTVQHKTKNKKTAIPTNALLFDDNKQQVVLRKGNHYEIKTVEISNQYKDSTFILNGIVSGDTIITKNNLLIYNFLKHSKNNSL